MDILKAIFEEQLEIRQDSVGNAVIGGTVFTPVAILQADKTAYDDEYSKWLSERWLPEQNEKLEEILIIHTNRTRFADLCTALKNNQVIPLIGSGMSVSSGKPAWSDFLRSIRPYSSVENMRLEEMLAASQYEEAVEELIHTMPGRLFDERIEHELRFDNASKITGAIQFLPELFDKLVLTTNLDDLLENLYTYRQCSFNEILIGEDVGRYRVKKATAQRILLKFHGDCRIQEGRVLGKVEYERAYKPASAVRDELMMIYRNYNLLCLGCSLGADRTVSLIGEVAALDKGMPKHYAFLSKPTDEEALRSRECFLAERGIFPIWYVGDHDDCIQTLFIGMLQSLGKI